MVFPLTEFRNLRIIAYMKTLRNPRLIVHLEKILRDRGYTQQRLAEETGISLGAINDVIKGRTALPGDNNLILICDVLHTTPGELIEVCSAK
jgi:putative transcriptional regulator